MTSTLFPHVAAPSRTTFGLALAALAVMLFGFAVLRWQAPLIAIGAVGVALVFVVYLRQAGHDVPVRQLVLTAALAAALGAAWALATGSIVAESHDVALSGGELDREKLLVGTEIPVGGAIVMLIPAGLLRLRRGVSRIPLDGYAVGVLSAVVFTSAATLVRLVPQFATGVRAEDLWVSALLVQAGIQGLTLPLTALALGGLVGIALWAGRRRMIVASVVVTLTLYTVMGVTEYTPVPHIVHLIVHIVIAAVALAALRGGQRALGPELPVRSPEEGTGRARVLAALGVGAAVAVTAGVVAAVLTTPDVPKIVCPPDCGRPPIGEPIESNPRFYAADGSFSVQYPGPGSAYEATLLTDGVELDFTGGDTGMLELFGLPAENRTAKQVAQDLIDEYYPDATTEYEIPNAMVGYEPGYGVVADDYPQDASGSFTRLRLIVMVAVKNDVALVASAIGPYREFTPDFGTGHPSGANLQLAIDMGKYVNSFRWTGVTD
ncbi:hypothetical protein AU190_24175 [Mycolicibacterium acapulense]|nr:hypothetical protein AU189_20280 [Mycolicibacterium acapulense]KUI06979.1 hypothetical protein AU191_22445 [Mycolicibacterium acapulense]KUI10102.1 hypothetical protein AU190_24175 [Mycolicibacterium acapulense]